MKKLLDESFDRGFYKTAFNAKMLLGTIPKSSHGLGAADKIRKGAGEIAEKVVNKAKTPAPSPRAMHGVTKNTSNPHANYMRSIGATGKVSKNEGQILKYKADGKGKTQFDSISPDPKTKIGPSRGTLK